MKLKKKNHGYCPLIYVTPPVWYYTPSKKQFLEGVFVFFL